MPIVSARAIDDPTTRERLRRHVRRGVAAVVVGIAGFVVGLASASIDIGAVLFGLLTGLGVVAVVAGLIALAHAARWRAVLARGGWETTWPGRTGTTRFAGRTGWTLLELPDLAPGTVYRVGDALTADLTAALAANAAELRVCGDPARRLVADDGARLVWLVAPRRMRVAERWRRVLETTNASAADISDRALAADVDGLLTAIAAPLGDVGAFERDVVGRRWSLRPADPAACPVRIAGVGPRAYRIGFDDDRWPLTVSAANVGVDEALAALRAVVESVVAGRVSGRGEGAAREWTVWPSDGEPIELTSSGRLGRRRRDEWRWYAPYVVADR